MADITTTDGIPVKSALAVAVSMAVAGHADDVQAQEDGARSSGIEETSHVVARATIEALKKLRSRLVSERKASRTSAVVSRR